MLKSPRAPKRVEFGEEDGGAPRREGRWQRCELTVDDVRPHGAWSQFCESDCAQALEHDLLAERIVSTNETFASESTLDADPWPTTEVIEVDLTLATGRTHQIRAQLARRGWPLCGDVMYHALHDAMTARLANVAALEAAGGLKDDVFLPFATTPASSDSEGRKITHGISWEDSTGLDPHAPALALRCRRLAFAGREFALPGTRQVAKTT